MYSRNTFRIHASLLTQLALAARSRSLRPQTRLLSVNVFLNDPQVSVAIMALIKPALGGAGLDTERTAGSRQDEGST
jgi:hypothetical protein